MPCRGLVKQLTFICDFCSCGFEMLCLCQRPCHRTGSCMKTCWDNVWTLHGFWLLQANSVDSCTMSTHMSPNPVLRQTVQNPRERGWSLKNTISMSKFIIILIHFHIYYKSFVIPVFVYLKCAICAKDFVTELAVVWESVGIMFGLNMVPDNSELILLIVAQCTDIWARIQSFNKLFKILRF